MNNKLEPDKEVLKMEELLSNALNNLFDPFMKYFETQECILKFKLLY